MEVYDTALILVPSASGHRWLLYDYYCVKVGRYNINVPKHFSTDFASVPRPLWALFPRWGKHGRAAVVHDYLYRTGEVSRREADEIFNVMMQEYKVRTVQRIMMYFAVRLFGGFSYNKGTKE